MEQIWTKVQHQLKSEIGDTAYRNWISPLTLIHCDDGIFRFAAPGSLIKNWVQTHYGDRIHALLKKAGGNISRIDFIVEQTPSFTASEKTPANNNSTDIQIISDEKPAVAYSVNSSSSEQLRHEWAEPLLSTLDPRFTFENFIVGQPNELAYAAARRVSESDTVGFNPLFLYGGVGLGKTHLMHAIAWAIHKRNPARNVVYMSAEKFMYRFIRALRYKDTVAFKEQFRAVDVLMIDDIQFIAGKESTQEEFFHTFNALADRNRQIILSADKSPSDLTGMEERLKSRLGWGLVADIHPSTYELRLGILQSKAEMLKAKVPTDVLEFLAHKITSNIRELEGALNRVVAHSELVGRIVSVDTTRDVLKDLLRANDKQLTLEDIQRKVAEHYGLRLSDMMSAQRSRTVARPRQMAMYLCKILTAKSLPDIGRSFGGRDHTTVMHAVKTVERLIIEDKALASDLTLLKNALSRS